MQVRVNIQQSQTLTWSNIQPSNEPQGHAGSDLTFANRIYKLPFRVLMQCRARHLGIEGS